MIQEHLPSVSWRGLCAWSEMFLWDQKFKALYPSYLMCFVAVFIVTDIQLPNLSCPMYVKSDIEAKENKVVRFGYRHKKHQVKWPPPAEEWGSSGLMSYHEWWWNYPDQGGWFDTDIARQWQVEQESRTVQSVRTWMIGETAVNKVELLSHVKES